MVSSKKGLRKGAWTVEEDKLLTKHVETYGEGKWHQVPPAAGLSRCRKSCRLRWLNYLKPNIKRGEFTADEVDLILRLHKLLGNRWSLIAGRLPGRTSNDVKNYWNTLINRKKKGHITNEKVMVNKSPPNNLVKSHNVIKPRPRTFTQKHSLQYHWVSPSGIEKNSNNIDDQVKHKNRINNNNNINNNKQLPFPVTMDHHHAGLEDDDITSIKWLESLLEEEEDDDHHVEIPPAASDHAGQSTQWNDLSFDNPDLWNFC